MLGHNWFVMYLRRLTFQIKDRNSWVNLKADVLKLFINYLKLNKENIMERKKICHKLHCRKIWKEMKWQKNIVMKTYYIVVIYISVIINASFLMKS